MTGTDWLLVVTHLVGVAVGAYGAWVIAWSNGRAVGFMEGREQMLRELDACGAFRTEGKR